MKALSIRSACWNRCWQPTGAGNSSQSSCFIPGSMLRGALVNLPQMRKAQGRKVVDRQLIRIAAGF